MSKSQIQSTVVMRYCNKLRTAGDLQLAAGICRRAHELDPTNPEPLIKLAEILQMLKLVPQAGEAYRAALLLDPTRTEATYGLGKVYMAQQRYDLAAAQFETAIFQDGENARYHNALAIVRDQQGDHQTAQLLYRHALELDPQNAGIRNNLGLSVTLAAKAPEQAPNHIASSSLGGLSLAKDADVAHDGDLEHPPAASTAKTTPARLATSVSPPPRRIMDEPEPKAEPTKASAVPMAEPEMAKATAAAHPAKPASSAMSGDLVYIAQLGSYGSESRAWQGWSDLQGTANDLLGTMKAMVVPADLGERGTFYRLRTAPLESETAGQALCASLFEYGFDCWLVKEARANLSDASMPAKKQTTMSEPLANPAPANAPAVKTAPVTPSEIGCKSPSSALCAYAPAAPRGRQA